MGTGIGALGTKRRKAVMSLSCELECYWPPLRLPGWRCERGSVDVVQARWLPK